MAGLLTATSLLLGAASPSRTSSTVVFLTLRLGQLGVALALRSRVTRRRSEHGLLVAVGIGVALMFAATYLPGPQALLRTQALSVGWLAVVLLFASVPGVVTRTLVPRSPPLRP